MGRMLQVRNLPNEVHEKLKKRAAAERMSLSDYVARELERLVHYRTNAEILAEAHARTTRIEHGDAVRALHESRDEHSPGWDTGIPREEHG